MISPEARVYFRKLHEGTPFGTEGFDLQRLREIMNARRAPSGGDARFVDADIDGTPAVWVTMPDINPADRFLYFHGGGFVSGSPDFYLTFATRLAEATRCAVLMPDYRLAPEYPFPAGLDDCIRASQWIRSHGPESATPAKSVYIGGDSAGGGLALSTLLALRDRSLPRPLAAVAISPFTDLTLSGQSYHASDTYDPILSARCMPDFVRLYINGGDPRHPLASPVFGDYTGTPPILIQVGRHEIIRDDSVQTAERIRSTGGSVALEIYDGMFHVFHTHEPLLPEAVRAFSRISAFIRSPAG